MYCSCCGYNLTGNENFCPSCGQKTESTNSLENKDLKSYSFSSKFLLGGNVITPDKLTISTDIVCYKKRNKYLIGEDVFSINLKNISSVEIDRKLIYSDIYIKGYGGELITVKNFKINEAKKIKKLIEERI